jgi:HK97 family phage portal protein
MGFFDFLNNATRLDAIRDIQGALEIRTSSIVPPPRSASSGVTTTDALSLSSVYRAAQIIATHVKSLSMKTYRDDVEVPAPLWVRNPSTSIHRAGFLEQLTLSLVLSGNAYMLVSRNGRGETMKLETLNPLDVAINTTDAGEKLSYTYRGTIPYSLTDVTHLSLLRVPSNAYGLGPIQAAQPELLNARDTRDYAANYWSMGIPSGILKTDQHLTAEQALAYKEAWNASAGAKNGVVILGNSLNYVPQYLSPRDSMFIEAQEWSRSTIASLFGIPANYLLANQGAGSSLTYTNLESEALAFIRGTLQVYTTEIEAAFSSLLPRSVDARFSFDSILRTDTLSRYQAHAIAIDAGFMTVDEVRRLENLGGDNMTGTANNG